MNQKGWPAVKGEEKVRTSSSWGTLNLIPDLSWLGVFYIDVIFGHLHINQWLINVLSSKTLPYTKVTRKRKQNRYQTATYTFSVQGEKAHAQKLHLR
jgi:hypothetical protein